MKKPHNPFVLSGYQGKKWFCNREKELKELKGHLKNERNVVLYAWRRLGKTALIKRLFDDLQKEYDVFSIDLLATENLQDATRAVVKAVYEHYGKTSTGLSESLMKLFSSLGLSLSFDPHTGVPEVGLGIHAASAPQRSLQSIGQFLAKRNKQVVIALDEFQQVSCYEEKNAEAVFREWMQQFPGIRFIYSGSHRKLMQAMFTEKNRPFYQSAQLMLLDTISESEYNQFIQKHFTEHGLSISEGLVHELYLWSRGQTYCIQLLCNYLFGYHKKVDRDLLRQVCDQVLEQQTPVFSTYRKILTATQWSVLQAIAREEPLSNPMSKEFLSKHDLGAASTVSTALAALREKELVIEEKGEFFVHDVLLTRWLQRLG